MAAVLDIASNPEKPALVRTIDDRDETVQAKLIGTEGGYVYEIGGKIAVNPPGRVVLPSLPKGLISKPSLVWLLENRQKNRPIEASYLTNGINWKANYVALGVVPTGPAEMSFYHSNTGQRYVLRTDGFISIHAGADQGEFVTKAVNSFANRQFRASAVVGGIA